jgi:hypothetical protein
MKDKNEGGEMGLESWARQEVNSRRRYEKKRLKGPGWKEGRKEGRKEWGEVR